MNESRSFLSPTTYFLHEGQENTRQCIELSFEAAIAHDIKKLIIFTAVGDGVKIAIQEFLTRPQFKEISVIAVGFPAGRIPLSVSREDLDLFRESGVPFVRAHLPFDPIHGTFQERGTGQGLSLLGSVLEIFCGSMNLCVQAALMACDAFVVEPGEHVISLTSDTSVLVQACPTCNFLTDFVVREVFCKPALLTISKKEERRDEPEENQLPQAEPKELANGQSSQN